MPDPIPGPKVMGGPSEGSSPGARVVVGLVSLVVASVALATALHWGKSIWVDDAFGITAAADWRLMWARNAENHGSMWLYYLLLWALTPLSDGEAFFRAVSTLFLAAAIVAVYMLVRTESGSRTALLCSALLALHPFALQQAGQIRPYAMVLFLTILSSHFFWRSALGGSRDHLLAWVVVSFLAVQAHYIATLVLLAQAAFLVVWRPALLRSVRVFSAAMALGVLLAGVLVAFRFTPDGHLDYANPIQMGHLQDVGGQMGGGGGKKAVVFWVLWIAAVLPLWRGRSEGVPVPRPPWLSWLTVWMLFPPLVAAAVSMILGRAVFSPRYFVICLPPLAILLGHGLRALGPHALRWGLLLAIAAIYGRGVWYTWANPQVQDWKAAAQLLLSEGEPGDLAIAFDYVGSLPLGYYLDRGGPGDGPELVDIASGHWTARGDRQPDPDLERMMRLAVDRPQVWLVLGNYHNDLTGRTRQAAQIRETLDTRCVPKEEWTYSLVEVRRYQDCRAPDR